MQDIKEIVLNKADQIAKELKKGNNIEIRSNKQGEITVMVVKKSKI